MIPFTTIFYYYIWGNNHPLISYFRGLFGYQAYFGRPKIETFFMAREAQGNSAKHPTVVPDGTGCFWFIQ